MRSCSAPPAPRRTNQPRRVFDTRGAAPQRRKLFEDLGDAHDGERLRADHAVEPGGGQTQPAHAKRRETRFLPAEGGQQTRAMPVARGLAGRDQQIQEVDSLQSTSLPLTPDLRLRRTGARLAQRGSTERLVPRALTLPRRAPPPL